MADSRESRKNRGRQTPSEVGFEFIRSEAYRTIPVSGAWGSVVPGRLIHMVLYSEHQQFPSSVEHALKEDGTLGPETRRSTPSTRHFTRELEVAAVFTKDVATSLVAWLTERINAIEEMEGGQGQP